MKMTELIRTSSENTDFNWLIELLDNDLWKRYPQTQQNYTKHNFLRSNVKAIVAYEEGKPVGCGCFRETDTCDTVEIKRMYVLEWMRGKGIATMILSELEKWAAGLGMKEAVLDTGINQPEAIALYEKSGYRRIKNYGPYINNREIICMGKVLSKG
jgi:GNAT superfamily N-acetyltransferase